MQKRWWHPCFCVGARCMLAVQVMQQASDMAARAPDRCQGQHHPLATEGVHMRASMHGGPSLSCAVVPVGRRWSEAPARQACGQPSCIQQCSSYFCCRGASAQVGAPATSMSVCFASCLTAWRSCSAAVLFSFRLSLLLHARSSAQQCCHDVTSACAGVRQRERAPQAPTCG